MSISRRQFLGSASVAAAAAVPYFSWQASGLADEPTSKNDRVAIGLIGAGNMGVG
ncbi:MAG: twin-arginine translocation signal domain-containing protein, partial [Planctomycetia bacterium]|nr:twin-arginine translocation signal domain-containing protein [Planctomycetia bacterium]